MTTKKKEDGIEYPADFDKPTDEAKKEPVAPVAADASKDEKIAAGKEIIANVENKAPTVPVTVITRANIVTIKDALKALPTSFSELNVESRRATIELGFATQIVRSNAYLQKCDPKSIFDAVMYSARIGITLNPALGLCYLVPRGNKCCLDIGYKGWRATLVSYGAIQHIDAYVVYTDEIFTWNPATGELNHIPKVAPTESEHKKRIVHCAYSKAILPSGISVYEVIDGWELEKIKNVSPASRGFSPYTDWSGEMTRKAPIKRHAKKLQVLQGDDRVAAMFENEQRNDNAGEAKKKTASRWDVETEFEEVG